LAPDGAKPESVDSPRTLAQPGPGVSVPATPAPAGRPGLCGGTLVLDRYRLLERLGAGGFGVVWRARDEELGREVALKCVLWEAWGSMPCGGGGARREALASARLTHPAIAALYEAREDGEALYLISELVDGVSLKSRIADGSLQDREIVAIGLAVCEALIHAHARGVIHRDVTPANVIVPRVGAEPGHSPAKLTDFGSALLVSDEDRRAGREAGVTQGGEILGTLAYMAPEQGNGGRAGPETDLYALALVLYEALAGVNPLRGASTAETARRLGTRLPPLELHRPDLCERLAHAIDRALLPVREQRGTVAELASALQAAAVSGRRSARPAAAGAGRRIAPRPGASSPPPPTRREPLVPRAGHTPAQAEARRLPASGEPMQPAQAAAPGGAWAPGPAGMSLPRMLWWAGALAVVIWQALAGRAGLALIIAAAALPLVALPRRAGPEWLLAALAPALGLVGLAGAYPAIGGQAARWSARAALGALGYWWLLLAQPLAARQLWLLPEGHHLPPTDRWLGSLSVAFEHVLRPLLTVATVEGAAVWAGACVLLPWLVRGRGVGRDVLMATVWAAALLTAERLLDNGLAGAASAPTPRGALLGAILGGAIAVCARALRGPVQRRAAMPAAA